MTHPILSNCKHTHKLRNVITTQPSIRVRSRNVDHTSSSTDREDGDDGNDDESTVVSVDEPSRRTENDDLHDTAV